ncbi:hypothetical protein HGO23_14625 [Xenorhabdus budapestensis]|uniref:Uncharacterized protein n=1 Tax=Xenorhabdus budapestensis TaxID=290110 RepID=A0ABX7VH00_XENBU|nr:hypothetical protein [Xenorhabdus budapestensis]QTL39077.1 hypothetical protein HGO23_14625 [Xenorhabdus budapestensis]
MSKKTISPAKYVYIYHLLCFYISISFLLYYMKSPKTPVIIFLGMIFIVLIIIFHEKIGLKIKINKKISLYYTSIIFSMLSSLFLLSSCFTFIFIKKTGDSASTIVLFICSILCLLISILTFTSNSINKKNNLNPAFLSIVKVIWILLSYFFYSFSRGAVAEEFDISYESTLSKPTTIGLTIIFITMVYLTFTVFLPVILALFEKKPFDNKKSKEIYYSSLPIAIPILLLWLFTCILLNVNIDKAINSIIEITIPMETRSTFFCNENYMSLPEKNTTRYMSISNDEYRAFIKTQNSWTVSRLKCQDKEPYYKLTPVKTIESIN